MKFSQVPALGVRACMSSSTPWSLSVLTLSVRSVLPSILSTISALQISAFSVLNRSAHTRRYRRFASILTDADARLAVEVVVSLLPPVGLSPTTLRQLAWRTDSSRCLIYGRALRLANRVHPEHTIDTFENFFGWTLQRHRVELAERQQGRVAP